MNGTKVDGKQADLKYRAITRKLVVCIVFRCVALQNRHLISMY